MLWGVYAGCAQKHTGITLNLYCYKNEDTNKARGIGVKSLIGHVFANDPFASRGELYAVCEVRKDGAIVDSPAVKWSTDFSEINLFPVAKRADVVQIRTFIGSQMGKGSVIAEYEGEAATMSIIAYGLFKIENNTGWCFSNNLAVSKEMSDLYFTFHSNSYYILHAPYGIKKVGTKNITETAFLEKIERPTEDNFVSELRLESGDIFEIIDAQGIHYKIAVIGALWNVYQDSSEYNMIEFAWDNFSEEL